MQSQRSGIDVAGRCRVTATSFAVVLGPLAGIAASLMGALPARGAEVPFTLHVISTSANFPLSVFATDMDGDGDIDVLSTSRFDHKVAWYENDGGSPPSFTERVISTTGAVPQSVFAIDLDNDTDTDVLVAYAGDDEIRWYENDGGSPPSFTERVISTTGIVSQSVFATDVDGDGDIDVLSALGFADKIAWYENDGGSPPTFTERVISTTADNANSVFATDVDGDGDIDVLSASALDGKIAWYESDGGSPPTFTERVISTAADQAQSVFATDVDGDGDTDVLSAAAGDIAWYDSNGGSPPSFTERVISSNGAPLSVFATDVDGDGDTDVLSASLSDGGIAWYDNNGGSPPSFAVRVISSNNARFVFATDLDGDGDTDVLSTPAGDIAWYENTTPPCGNGVVGPGEECDGGVGCTDCLCDEDFEPTSPPSLDCQPTCGNGSVDPGEQCDGLDDAECPGACLSDCRCGLFCGDGVCDPAEDSCNCPDDCGPPAQSEVPGSTCTDGLDNDCDGDADCDDPDCKDDDPACEGVPTVSQWGMAVLLVALLAGIALKFRRSRTT